MTDPDVRAPSEPTTPIDSDALLSEVSRALPDLRGDQVAWLLVTLSEEIRARVEAEDAS